MTEILFLIKSVRVATKHVFFQILIFIRSVKKKKEKREKRELMKNFKVHSERRKIQSKNQKSFTGKMRKRRDKTYKLDESKLLIQYLPL